VANHGLYSLKGGAVDFEALALQARSAARKNLRPISLEEVAVEINLPFWIRVRLTAVSQTLRVRFAAFLILDPLLQTVYVLHEMIV
jgi:hypothetical protein